MRGKAIGILCALALGGFVLGAAGCGSSGKTAATTDTTAADTTAMTTTDTTSTDTTATTSTDTTATTATDTTGTTSTPGFSFLDSGKCQQYLSFASNFVTALSGAGGADTEKAAQAFQQLAHEAPDEIKGDFQTVADAYSKIADALKGTDLSNGQPPSAQVIAKLARLGQQIDEAKVSQAASNISDWLTQNCTHK
jgi:hypothetical protein